MTGLVFAFALAFGLIIGSFLNVCIYRLPRRLSIVRPRSFCPACNRTIAWYDNVPVLSFALLRGRCRGCKASIPFRYPLVELATGLLFAWIAIRFGPGLEALKLCCFAALGVGLIGSDLEERTLPDGMTIGGTIAGLAFAALVPLPAGAGALLTPWTRNPRVLSFDEALLGAAVSSVAIWAVGEIYYRVRRREGLGLGDVKMIAMIGAFLGLQGALLTMIVGSIAGGLAGLAFILITRRSVSTYQLPFGAFLGIASLLVALFGDSFLSWYFGFAG